MNDDLVFKDLENIVRDATGGEWVTVFSNKKNELIFCAFVLNKKVKEILDDSEWDLNLASKSNKGNIKNLVYRRYFYGIKDKYYDICEDFRLYLNLYEDKNRNIFIKINDNGDDEEVIWIKGDEVKVKKRYLNEYLVNNDLSLAIYFNIDRFSNKTLQKLNLVCKSEIIRDTDYIFKLIITDEDEFLQNGFESAGLLTGKRVIKPNISLRKEAENYEEFIVDIDENGNKILSTCNPDKLANFDGKNSKSYNFCTPVPFKKEVLNKYYDDTEKYIVKDGHLLCGGLWSLRIDNNNNDYISVFLGDLGQSLAYEEQKYWRSFNILTKGKISEVNWQRNFLCEFTDPQVPDLYFKYKFEEFQKNWKDKFGWDLFKSLSKNDRHCFNSIHSLSDENNYQEFDKQVGFLVKVLIDSLNEKKLKQFIKLEEGDKGIRKLEKFLKLQGFIFEEMLIFMRNLQKLRSTFSAHRKSEKSKKYKEVCDFFKIGNKSLKEVFDFILIESIKTLNSLEKIIK